MYISAPTLQVASKLWRHFVGTPKEVIVVYCTHRRRPCFPLARYPFAGDDDHYDLWMLSMESTFTKQEGNTYRTISESGQRYTPLQVVLAPFSDGDIVDPHRVGGVWSETPAFFTTMVCSATLDISKYRLPPATRPWKDQ